MEPAARVRVDRPMSDPATASTELDIARKRVAAGEARIAELVATAAQLMADGRNPRLYEDAAEFYADVRDHWRRAVERLEGKRLAQA